MADNQNSFNQNAKETADILKDAFMSLGAQIDDIFRRATTANDSFNKAARKDLTGTLNSLARNSQQLLDNDYKLQKGQLSSRSIAKQIYDITAKQSAAQASIIRSEVLSNRQKAKLLGETSDYFETQLKALNEQKDKSAEIENKIKGISGLVKGIGKIPIIGGFIDTKEVLEDIQQAAADGTSTMTAGFNSLGRSLKQNLLNPLTIGAYLLGETLKVDNQITKLAKSLNQSKTEATGTELALTGMAFASGDVVINTSKLVEATIKLGKNLGVAKVFSADVTVEFARLTERMGLAEDAAAGLAKISVMTGKNAHLVTTEALGTAQALQAQAGIQLDNKQVLEEVGKVSGQLLANFQASPAKIAAAVTQAKLLGTTLEITKKQSESLLDFQTSIQNELQAEIITGQQLNLERARGAALMGDQVTVMEELANQNVNFTKFSQMNVIAQKDLAAALGLSTDELSDQLAKQQFLGKSRAEVAALAGEEVANRLQALSVQERFNASMQKLQDALTPVLTALAFVLDKTFKFFTLDFKGFVGADDLMSGYGQRSLVTPSGTYALNNNDTVIAGTNLFKGNDVYSGPAGALSLGSKEVVDAISNLGNRIDQLSDRPVVARPSEFATPISIKQLQNIRRSI